MIKKSSLLVLLISLALAGACGKADEDVSPLTLKIAWANSAGLQTQALPSGIVTLRATVTAPDMAELSQTYTDLDPNGGTLEIFHVPVGANRTLVMDGLDVGNQIISQGTIAGFNVVKHGSNDIGTIVMKPYIPGGPDTTPPDTTITSNPSAFSNSADASLGFTCSEITCTFECRLDSAGWSACTNPRALAGLADGSHTFEVRSTDGSGNVDATPAAYTWTIDTIAPDTAINFNPLIFSSSVSAVFEFSADELNCSFECRIDGGSWESCISPRQYVSLEEGPHTFDVRAVDQAANPDSTPASYAWTIDLIAPDTALTSYPDNPTNEISPVFKFSSDDADASFVCQIDNEFWETCVSPKTYYSLLEGSHSFTVKAFDPAGNADPSPVVYSWTIDITPPDTSITAYPANLTNQVTAAFSFNSNEFGSVLECKLDSGAWGVCSSPKVYSGLAAVNHTFRVRATDPAGNLELTPAVYTWTIDTQAPDTSISSYPQNPTNSISASFIFISNDTSATFECRLDAGNWGVCLSPKNYSSLSNGNHTFSVRALDLAGNYDPSPASSAWTVDFTAPNTNLVSYPSSLTNQVSAIFSFTSTETGSTFECKLDTGSFITCSSPKNYSGLSAGGHTFQVRAIDTAWNPDPSPASYGWTIDVAPPDTNITSFPSSPTNQVPATFQFTSTEAGSSFECKLDNGFFTTCVSPKTYSSGLTDGTHYFRVRAIDTAWNPDPTPASYAWTVDTVPPDTNITFNPSNPANQTSASFSFDSTETGSSFECELDKSAWSSCTSTKTYPGGLTEGTHFFKVRAIDTAWNPDPTPDAYSWTIDTTPPDTIVDSYPPSVTYQTSADFSFSSNEIGSAFECKLDKDAWAGCTSPKNYPGSLTEGNHYFSVRATDPAGNVDLTPAFYSWKISFWVEMGAGSASGGGISNNAGTSYYPSMIIGSDGNPIIAWADDTSGNYEIYVKRWNGSTWAVYPGAATGCVSNNSGSSQYPSIILGSDGKPIAAWNDNSNGNNEIYIKRWDGSNWVEMGAGSASGGGISNNSGDSRYPSLVLGPDGKPAVAWQDYSSGNYEIYVKRWDGSNWVEMNGSASGGGISSNSGNSANPSLIVGSDGNPIVAWMDISNLADYEIYIRRWDGSSWVEIGGGSASGNGISNDSGDSELPSLVLGPDGKPIVAWHDTYSGTDIIYVKRWDGADWAEMGAGSASGTGISGLPADSHDPSMILGSDGNPIVAWHDYSNGFEIYLKRWNGSSWVEMGTGSASGGGISNNSGDSTCPSLILGSDGKPIVAWQDDSVGNYEIFVRKWTSSLPDGTAWVEMGAGSASGGGISSNSGFSTYPSLILGPDGRPTAAWHDDSGGNYEAYARRWDGSNWIEIGAGSASGGGISNNAGGSNNAALLRGPDGNTVAVWQDNSNGNNEIYGKKWNGSSWVEMGAGSASGGGISNNAGESNNAAVLRGPDGNTVAVWQDNSSGNYQIYGKKWNGSSWVAMGTGSASGGGISGTAGLSYSPSIASYSDGTTIVAWHDFSSGNWQIYLKRWNGASWAIMGTGSASGGGVSNTSGASQYPSIILGSDGQPILAWQSIYGGTNEIYVKKWNGSSWVEMGTGSASGSGISNNSGESLVPCLALGSDGNPIVAWDDNSSGNYEIYVKRWNGSAWVEIGTGSASGGGISGGSGASTNPSIIKGSDGKPIMGWMDDSSGNYEIYVKKWQ